MAEYINKDALVAEIERLKSIQLSIFSRGETEESCYESLSCISIYNEVLSLIDTIEVKDANEALRTEYEKGRADTFAQMQKEWSEDDDWMKTKIINVLLGSETFLTPEDTNECIYWLKFLKQRIGWKPSEEQITVLELASKYERVFTPKQIDILINLKEQLKKLKGH